MSIDMIVALIMCAPVLLLMWCGRKATRSSRMFVVVVMLGVMALSMVTSGCSTAPSIPSHHNSVVSEEDMKLVSEYLSGTKREPVSVPTSTLTIPTIKVGKGTVR